MHIKVVFFYLLTSMPKTTYKHFRHVSRRHFYRLVQQKANITAGCTTSYSYPCQSDNSLEISSCSGPSGNCENISDPIFSNTNSDQSLTDSDDDGSSNSNEDLNEIPDLNENFTSSSDENSPLNESNLDDTHNSSEPCSPDYITKLANWASNFNINQNAINALLEIQRSERDYFRLPKDSRTLLKTPRTTIVRSVEPGHPSLGFASRVKHYLAPK
jgi:hypothetical protein